jgi:DNA-binding MarR family transcriptional regulator
MGLTEDIMLAYIRMQELAGLDRHGGEETDRLGLAEVHCVDWIGRLENANVTRIAGRMSMTRGAISKIAKRLMAKGLIESYRLPGDNKAVYFRPTAGGWRVFEAHRKCHDMAQHERAVLLAAYSEEEKAVVLRFLNDMRRLYERRAKENS